MKIDEFVNAGLYDPASPGADDRLALLEWLVEKGVTIEQMVAADREGSLPGIAGRLQLRPVAKVSLRDISDRCAVPLTEVEKYYAAFGMPPVAANEPVMTEEEAGMFGALFDGALFTGANAMRRLLNLISIGTAALGEAGASKTITDSESQGELAQAKLSLRGIETIPALERVLTLSLRFHIAFAGRRLRHARLGAGSKATFRFAVGFVDLVGFTTLSSKISYDALGELVDRFETIAHDVVTLRGGRVVKFIGDEVMFVSDNAAAACDIALALIEEFRDDPQVKPRAGVAYGDLLVRGGDYCGPVVNLAARLAELAVRSEVLATTSVAENSDASTLRFDPAGSRMLRGFDEPVRVLNVVREG